MSDNKQKRDDARGGGRRRGSSDGSATLLAHGEPMVWLTGGGLALAVVMIIGLLALVVYQGIFTFLPVPVVRTELHDGRVHMGEVTRRDRYEPTPAVLEKLPETVLEAARAEVAATGGWAWRRLVRTGNYELSGEHFDWVSDYEVARESFPEWALVIERVTWGRYYGEPVAFELAHPLDNASRADAQAFAALMRPAAGREIRFRVGGQLLPADEVAETAVVDACVEIWRQPADVWQQFSKHHEDVRERLEHRQQLEKRDTGQVSHRSEAARLALREAELEVEKAEKRDGPASPRANDARRRLEAQRVTHAAVDAESLSAFKRIRAEIQALNQENARYRLVMKTTSTAETAIPLSEIVRAYPANQLSLTDKIGIYFSRWVEFLADDPREANMEGGVWPAIFGTVVMTMIMSMLVVPFGVLAALYLREYAKAGPMISAVRIAINNLAGVPSIVFGVFGLGFFCYLVGGTIDQIFFEAKLPNPTYGTGGVMWASFTLALLTLPVVIVATEEALSAVPGSMREGSYACGASKWQTIKRIVLPRAMPGIMTGMILAMARGAGEVAPLMLVGAVKLAPELPIDGVFPFLHPERSFMHLGFHIFDLGFQSQNSEAAKPMVFTTTLLLIAIVAALNISAIMIRNRLRKRFQSSAF
jgi:phosphate transport system permease protein